MDVGRRSLSRNLKCVFPWGLPIVLESPAETDLRKVSEQQYNEIYLSFE